MTNAIKWLNPWWYDDDDDDDDGQGKDTKEPQRGYLTSEPRIKSGTSELKHLVVAKQITLAI